jgi:hypothetical protein
MGFFTPYTIVLILSFLTSLTIYLKPRATESFLKFFPPFLFLTLVVELIGFNLGQNNALLYNIFSTFEFCFYLVMINLIITRRSVKMIITVTTVIYALTALINIFFIQKPNVFHTTTYSLGCLVVVAFCIYYFFELFRLPTSVNLMNNPAFWICSGLLFFYCCSFPLYGFMSVWIKIPLIVKNFKLIVAILNIFLYCLFMIAFLCRIRTRKYILSPL